MGHPTKTNYHLDASSFLEIWEKSEGQAKRIHSWLDQKPEFVWQSSRFVLEELRRKNEELADLLGECFPDEFHFPTDEEQERLKTILKKYPKLVDAEDPSPQVEVFLVASAAATGGTIVFSRERLASILFSSELLRAMDDIGIDYFCLEDVFNAIS